MAVLLPTSLAIGGTYLGVHVYGSYGLALFVATPICATALAGWILRRADPKITYLEAMPAAWLVPLLTVVMLVVLGEEGIICLALASPLLLVLTHLGLGLGLALTGKGGATREQPTSLAGLAFVPFLTTSALVPSAHYAERLVMSPPTVREATTRIVIAAPIERVWQEVVGFSRIEAPPDLLSRMGVAYPIEARLVGEGVGAVRHCVFSTGEFVEPITRWEPPHVLAFDVRSAPPPMRELSFHDHVAAPHLSTAFVSHRGQFVLSTQADGRVLVEATTWFTHDLAPDWYWGAITDHVIHRIHRRVLDHIALEASR